ncbi:MAG: hypothetical protein HYT86_01820 [candidate division NC10 bacterium]|nr:hypothetical protein [candidate division NC10 bacterium]
MRAVQGGDEAAFRLLYRRYERRLLAFLIPYLGDPALAEDLLQETFLRVYRRRAAYEPRGAFRTSSLTVSVLRPVSQAWFP